MDNKIIETMQFGNNHGLNSTLDIIKETYKNFQLVAPMSPFKKRKGILDQTNTTSQIINKTRLADQINKITISFIQQAFQIVVLDYDELQQINSQNMSSRNTIKSELQSPLTRINDTQRRNSINIQKKIIPFEQTTIGNKSKFNQNNQNSDNSGDLNRDQSSCSIISNEKEDENGDEDELKDVVSPIPNDKGSIQNKEESGKKLVGVVDRLIERKRRNSQKIEFISKLGVNKEMEDKFERFMSKNFTKLQRQDTKQQNNQSQKIETQQNQEQSIINSEKNSSQTITFQDQLVSQSSLDKIRAQKQEIKDYYEEILSKENVDISNPEDGWMIIEILKKQKKSRNEKLFIKRSLQNINLFQRHKDAVFKNSQTNERLFESLGYRQYKRNEVIFQIGDEGDTYYIVLRGSVVLLLPKSNEDAEQLEKEAEIRRKNKRRKIYLKNTKFFSRNPKKIEDRDHIVQVKTGSLPIVFTPTQNKILEKKSMMQMQKQDTKEEERKQSEKIEKQVLSPQHQNVSLPSNQDNNEDFSSVFIQNTEKQNIKPKQNKQTEDKVSFFELARFLKTQETDFNFYANKSFPLMKQIRIFGPGEAFGEIALLTKSRRTGTMICKEDSHVMTLKKDGFDKIMGYYNNVIINERIKFFREFEFMKQIPESKLMVLLHETKIQYFTRNQIIYTENDPLLYMYFIKEGEVTISEKVLINPPRFQYQLSLNKQTNQQNNQIEYNPSEQDIFDKFCLKSFKEQNKQKRMVVYSQSNSSFFGELELIDKQANTRYQQAICTSMDCTIFIVRKEILLQFLRRFGGINQLIEESNGKRALQQKLIEEFQNKKCEKIIRSNQIKYERLKRKQFIKEQLTVKNRRQSCIDQFAQSSNQNTNNSGFIQNWMPSPSQRISLDQKQMKDHKKEENIQTPKNSIQQKEQSEIKKSCVGQKNIDEAITRAFFTPGIDWTNPCYRSLDNSKFQNNLLNKKLEDLNNKEYKKAPEKDNFLLMWDQIQKQKDTSNQSFQFFVPNSTKNRKSKSILSTNGFNAQQQLSSSDYFYQKQISTPTSNQSIKFNKSMSNFKDFAFFNTNSHRVNKLEEQNTSQIVRNNSTNQQDTIDFSTTNNSNFIETQASKSHKINLILNKEKRKNRSDQYFRSYYSSQDSQQTYERSNDQIIEDIPQSFNTTNKLTSSSTNVYSAKLNRILKSGQKQQSTQDQKRSSQMSNTQQSGFLQNLLNPHKTQNSFTTTIRKFNTNYSSFYQQSESTKLLLTRQDYSVKSQHTFNLLQDNMFKTSKQLKQELQTQTQIKNTILKQFMKDSCQTNPSNDNKNNQLDLLYNDPQETKALQKAMFAKLLHIKKKPKEQKPKQFNKVHIDIIQKLKIPS